MGIDGVRLEYTPAGTTIDAVASLEQDGFRSAVIRAMTACAEKSRSMAQPTQPKP